MLYHNPPCECFDLCLCLRFHVIWNVSWQQKDFTNLHWFLQHKYLYLRSRSVLSYHNDVIKWKHFPRYWPFVRGIHRSPQVCLCLNDIDRKWTMPSHAIIRLKRDRKYIVPSLSSALPISGGHWPRKWESWGVICQWYKNKTKTKDKQQQKRTKT